jgi:hypothetical protein
MALYPLAPSMYPLQPSFSLQAPLQAAPVVVQSQAAPQQGLTDVLTIIQTVGQIINAFGGIPGVNPPTNPPTTDSGTLTRVSDTLNRVDAKLDRLQNLIDNRLKQVEGDVATLQKAQKETSAQIDQRLTAAMQLNTANTAAILRTQQETGFLLDNAKTTIPNVAPTPPTGVTQDIDATAYPGNSPISIKKGTKVEILGDLSADQAVIRWKVGNNDTKIGVAKKSDVR